MKKASLLESMQAAASAIRIESNPGLIPYMAKAVTSFKWLLRNRILDPTNQEILSPWTRNSEW